MTIKLPEVLTVSALRRLKACKDEVDAFKDTFPTTYKTGVAITLRNARKAEAARLSLSWLLAKWGLLTNLDCSSGFPWCSCVTDFRGEEGTPELFMAIYRTARKAQVAKGAK